MRGRKNGLLGNFRINETGCWNWQRYINPKQGYGMCMYMGQSMPVPRMVGALYLGLDYRNPKIQVLHRCDNPACVNPKHLFLGSQLENVRDCMSKGRTWFQRRGDFCKHGHALTVENTYRDQEGYRGCRTCRRTRYKKWHDKLTQIPTEAPLP
jgi:hypothetical protein